MKRSISLILLLSLIGMGVSLYLTRLHYQAIMPGHMVDSFCNVNATVNCVATSASEYAVFPHTLIPTASLGFIYYLIVFVLSLVGFSTRTPPLQVNSTFLFLFLFSLPALGFTAYMAAMSKKLGILCLLCLAMYALNILIFLLLPNAAGSSWKQIGMALKTALAAPAAVFGKSLVIALALLAGGSAISWKVSQGYELARKQAVEWQERQKQKQSGSKAYTPQDIQEILDIFYKQPILALNIPANRPRWGHTDAPLQVVKFVDFQCPACKQASETIPDFLNEAYRGQFSIVLLNYPLNSDCNPNLKRKMHPFGCLAAKVGVCASTLGGEFWDYDEQTFGHQGEINEPKLYEWAQAAGADPNAVKSCIASPETAAYISEDIKLGEKIPVEGTPTILLNGRNIQNLWRDPVLFKAVLDAELKRTHPLKLREP